MPDSSHSSTLKHITILYALSIFQNTGKTTVKKTFFFYIFINIHNFLDSLIKDSLINSKWLLGEKLKLMPGGS